MRCCRIVWNGSQQHNEKSRCKRLQVLLLKMIKKGKIRIQSYKSEEVLKSLLKEGPRQTLEISKEY